MKLEQIESPAYSSYCKSTTMHTNTVTWTCEGMLNQNSKQDEPKNFLLGQYWQIKLPACVALCLTMKHGRYGTYPQGCSNNYDMPVLLQQ